MTGSNLNLKKNRDVQRILQDPLMCISKLRIVRKDGKVVPFTLNQEQVQALNVLVSGANLLILKPRQIGASTLVGAYLFWKALTATEPITIAIVSHKMKSAQQLFKMHKQFYASLPKLLRPALSIDNTTEMQFADSGARIIAISAGGEGGLRSFTCNYAHLSEYAFSPEPEELMAVTRAALNDGQLIVESTANHYGDALHNEVLKASRGEAGWSFLFFPWYEHKEYVKEAPSNFSLTAQEQELVTNLGLSNEQINWRRTTIQRIGLDKFTREYPATVDEAYATTGDTLLRADETAHITTIPTTKEMTLQSPVTNDLYSLGADTSGGVGKDYSTIQVISKRTNNVVYSYRNNQISPVLFAAKIQEVATLYNKALVLVESNNTGAVVLNELHHLGYKHLWKEDDKDWITTGKSKAILFEALRNKVRCGGFAIMDQDTYNELRLLQIDTKGTVKFGVTNTGSHCDNVMALALANIGLDKVKLTDDSAIESFLKQRQLQKLKQTTGSVANQHRRY